MPMNPSFGGVTELEILRAWLSSTSATTSHPPFEAAKTNHPSSDSEISSNDSVFSAADSNGEANY